MKPLFLLVLSLHVVVSVRDNSTNEFSVENEDSRVLSRRKRFLTFPDGSSLQLVFCVQTSALIPIGDIFLYGSTAALAWTLPADPTFTEFFTGKDKAQRREDVRNINYVDERGRVIARVPYKRRPIVNPAFAKRSVDEPQTFKEKLKMKIDRMKMHEMQTNREYLKKEHLDEKSIEFHRSNRLELLQRIERLLTA
ncbi:uncharacterized protein LOC119188620 [Manduca sexta]|nr:uncharacterized protein LOC119188620 [Manduca sexta]